jgi:hypothetical protein
MKLAFPFARPETLQFMRMRGILRANAVRFDIGSPDDQCAMVTADKPDIVYVDHDRRTEDGSETWRVAAPFQISDAQNGVTIEEAIDRWSDKPAQLRAACPGYRGKIIPCDVPPFRRPVMENGVDINDPDPSTPTGRIARRNMFICAPAILSAASCSSSDRYCWRR